MIFMNSNIHEQLSRKILIQVLQTSISKILSPDLICISFYQNFRFYVLVYGQLWSLEDLGRNFEFVSSLDVELEVLPRRDFAISRREGDILP